MDVGGGIGSTTMQLANVFSRGADGNPDANLEFIIQERQVVVEIGEKAFYSCFIVPVFSFDDMSI